MSRENGDKQMNDVNETTSSAAASPSERKTTVSEGATRRSISIRMIRHAESWNNEVYRNARYIYRGGTADFDEKGWWHYVETHRSADPTLSQVGLEQASKLCSFLVPNLTNQASNPVQIICSPMRRTLDTIAPTIRELQKYKNTQEYANTNPTKVVVNGFFFESEGCHTKDQPEEGMSPQQIRDLLQDPDLLHHANNDMSHINFVGFPDMNRGWYLGGKGAETRVQSEERAAKFYLWLCEYLDAQLQEAVDASRAVGSNSFDDVFDAGVAVPGEENENEHDKYSPRVRRRRTTLLVGHGDFMSLVLKRIVSGYGHCVENQGIPHRSAFVHFNTGTTELEYFGKGRFLLMTHNHTPHFAPHEYARLRSGGSLKDGWSYLMPQDEVVSLNVEVAAAFADEDVDPHIAEQAQALKSLYLSSKSQPVVSFWKDQLNSDQLCLTAETDERERTDTDSTTSKGRVKHFYVKQGFQVVGVATYHEADGKLYDVAVRPSVGKEATWLLFDAVRQHVKQNLKRSGSLVVLPRSLESKELFEQYGFTEMPILHDE
jgi:hypothetical protein